MYYIDAKIARAALLTFFVCVSARKVLGLSLCVFLPGQERGRKLVAVAHQFCSVRQHRRKVQLRPLVGPIAINKNLIWHLRFTGTSIKDFPLNQHQAQGAKQGTSCNLLAATGYQEDFSRLLQGVLKNYIAFYKSQRELLSFSYTFSQQFLDTQAEI
jgi:hypothetical protein